MSRGRKKITTNGLDWEGLFSKSQGVYFQFILSELGKKTDFSITNDTGAELLEKIKAEKAQLIKAKKLKAEKDFPAIKPNEIPFEIPKNWVWCRLGEIGICRTGTTPSTVVKEYFGNDIPFVKPADITLRGLILDNEGLSFKGVQEGVLIPKNSVLMVCIGGSIGKSYFNEIDVSCNQQINTITPLAEIKAQFLQFYLQSEYFQKAIWAKASGGTTPIVNRSKWETILFPLPPLSEQTLFLAFLQDFGNQSLIEDKAYFDSETEEKVLALHESQLMGNQLSTELTHQLDLVKQLRQSFLREAMQGKLVTPPPSQGRGPGGGVETGQQLLAQIKAEKAQLIAAKKLKKEKDLPPIKPEDIPFEIPEHWTWCRLGEIAYIASGSTPKPDAFIPNGIPYLKMYNLRGQKIDFEYKPQYIKEEIHNGQLKRSRTQVGDVIMNIVGPPLGKLAIIPDTLPESNFNQAAVLIRPYINQNLNKWIFWYLSEMSEINSIVTKGVAGQDNISITQSNNMKIPIAPLSEQRRIVEKLESLMQMCDALEASIKDSQGQNQQLLQQVLREALRK